MLQTMLQWSRRFERLKPLSSIQFFHSKQIPLLAPCNATVVYSDYFASFYHLAWLPRLGAPVFCKPVADLFFNLSISTSTVPLQWKKAYIRPVHKQSNPKQHSDYHPISITPVLASPQ